MTDVDIDPEEFDRLIAAVGAKLAELTGMPLEQAGEPGRLGLRLRPHRRRRRNADLPRRRREPRRQAPLPAFAEILDDDEEDGEDPEEER